MRALFVRHGQSTGNAGIPCDDLGSIPLTELGWAQSREVAASWAETPDLIVTSPYLRTRSTERMPFLELYWKDADPEYWDGEGAETKPPSRIRPGSFRPAPRQGCLRPRLQRRCAALTRSAQAGTVRLSFRVCRGENK